MTLLKYLNRITPRVGDVRLQTTAAIHVQANKLDQDIDDHTPTKRWRVHSRLCCARNAIDFAFQRRMLKWIAMGVEMTGTFDVSPWHMEITVKTSRLANWIAMFINEPMHTLIKAKVMKALE